MQKGVEPKSARAGCSMSRAFSAYRSTMSLRAYEPTVGVRGFSENEASAPVIDRFQRRGFATQPGRMRIKDAKVRKRVLDLVRSLAEEIDKG